MDLVLQHSYQDAEEPECAETDGLKFSHDIQIPGPGSYSYTSSIRREFVPKAFQNFGLWLESYSDSTVTTFALGCLHVHWVYSGWLCVLFLCRCRCLGSV